MIGNMVQIHRKKAGLTQKELAELAGVGKTIIYDIEKGKNTIRMNSLMKILSALNIGVFLESPLKPLQRIPSDES